MTHDQTTPAPVEATLKPCPKPWCNGPASVYTNRSTPPDYEVTCLDCSCTGPSCNTKAEAIAAWNTRHSAPAGEVEPVAWQVSWHSPIPGVSGGRKIVLTKPDPAQWDAVTPLYPHPAPPADLVERIEQLDLLQETNLPNGEWDMETFRVTLALCKRHLSAALAKHGGA